MVASDIERTLDGWDIGKGGDRDQHNITSSSSSPLLSTSKEKEGR